MFYEGCEKKVEIFIDNQNNSLLDDIDDDFWYQFVHQCDALILKKIQNTQIKAFILSESSLIIWHHKILILTCGNTRLINGIKHFVATFDKQNILQLTYTRKSEYKPELQLSSFDDDVTGLLSTLTLDNAYFHSNKFGQSINIANDACQAIFNYRQHSTTQTPMFDSTTKIKSIQSFDWLARDINKQLSQKLMKKNLRCHEIRSILKLHSILQGFIFNDYAFSPYGYSLNAIKDDSFFSLHITPQLDHSYVSIHANFDQRLLAEHFIKLFTPSSFEFLVLTPQISNILEDQSMKDKYQYKSLETKTLSDQQCSFVYADKVEN